MSWKKSADEEFSELGYKLVVESIDMIMYRRNQIAMNRSTPITKYIQINIIKGAPLSVTSYTEDYKPMEITVQEYKAAMDKVCEFCKKKKRGK